MGCNGHCCFYPTGRLLFLSGSIKDIPDPKPLKLTLGHGTSRNYLPNSLLHSIETEAQKEEVIFPKGLQRVEAKSKTILLPHLGQFFPSVWGLPAVFKGL